MTKGATHLTQKCEVYTPSGQTGAGKFEHIRIDLFPVRLIQDFVAGVFVELELGRQTEAFELFVELYDKFAVAADAVAFARDYIQRQILSYLRVVVVVYGIESVEKIVVKAVRTHEVALRVRVVLAD